VDVLAVVVVVAIVVWLFMAYVKAPEQVKSIVATVVIILLILWLVGYYTPAFHWRR
jgi:hypothetical protein